MPRKIVPRLAESIGERHGIDGLFGNGLDRRLKYATGPLLVVGLRPHAATASKGHLQPFHARSAVRAGADIACLGNRQDALSGPQLALAFTAAAEPTVGARFYFR